MKTIYWAALLTKDSHNILLKTFPPLHDKVYAEHITLAFSPNKEVEDGFAAIIGNEVCIEVIGYAFDDNGQAIVVNGVDRLDGETTHITISCAEGIKPVYSNELLEKQKIQKVDKLKLRGIIAKYTNRGWIK